MAVSTIDGTLEALVLKRARGKIRVYERVTFKLDDGTSKSIAKAIVEESVAARLVPGAKGRFYLYTAFDHRGIHGLRDSDGKTVFGFATVNEKAMIWTIAIAIALIALSLSMMGGISIWGALLLILGVPFYFLYRKTRMDAERQFRAELMAATRDADGLARWAQWLLYANAAASGLYMLIVWRRGYDPFLISQGEELFGLASLLLFLGTAIIVLTWLYRANANARAPGPTT